MFRAASDDDIEAYSDSVTCFIRKCIEDVVPTKTILLMILQTGEHPQSCGSGWHPRPCAQSMRIPTSRGFNINFICGSLMLD